MPEPMAEAGGGVELSQKSLELLSDMIVHALGSFFEHATASAEDEPPHGEPTAEHHAAASPPGESNGYVPGMTHEEHPDYEAYERYCNDMDIPVGGSKVERHADRDPDPEPTHASRRPGDTQMSDREEDLDDDGRYSRTNGKTVRHARPAPRSATPVRHSRNEAPLSPREIALEKRLKALERENQIVVRYAALEKLASEGYALDPEEELKDTESMDDATFDRHITRITERYARSDPSDVTTRTRIPTASPNNQGPDPEPDADDNGLTEYDAKVGMVRYARDNPHIPRDQITESYIEAKQKAKTQNVLAATLGRFAAPGQPGRG